MIDECKANRAKSLLNEICMCVLVCMLVTFIFASVISPIYDVRTCRIGDFVQKTKGVLLRYTKSFGLRN